MYGKAVQPSNFSDHPIWACRMLPFGELTLRKMHLIVAEQATRHR